MSSAERLGPFIGTWTMRAEFPPAPPSAVAGQTVFEWMPGRQFIVQRWEVEHPDAPDGIAIIGFDTSRDTFLQHYFDSRGVARVYEMSVDDNTWTLVRTSPDFSPLHFSQRSWEHDFDLTYTKLS